MGHLMKIPLHGAGMTALHKAGLAGLYMTLSRFDETEASIPDLRWTLADDRVELDWLDESPVTAFESLLKESFKVDSEGFIQLTGLESSAPNSVEQKHWLYQALLNSFLQFGPHRPTEKKRLLAYEVDEKPVRISDFGPIKKFRHQECLKDFIDKNGFKPEVEVAGWLFPGSGQRHVAIRQSKFGESTELALCLLFAPVGSFFFLLRSRIHGRKARVALALPEFTSLSDYTELKAIVAQHGVLPLTAAGTTDAALRLTVLAGVRTRLGAMLANQVIRVITFGIVDWNEKQKSRTAVYAIRPGSMRGIGNYEIAHALFPNRRQRVGEKRNRKGEITEPESYFVRSYTTREIIADNIARDVPWYHDFSRYMTDSDLHHALGFERKELNQMIQQAEFDNDTERQLILACHEAWRRRLGSLGQRARDEDADFRTLANREYERIRVSLARCKNASSLRETLVDFWARGGSNPVLQEQWSALVPLLDDRHWKKARDLALLALVSYQPANAAEAEAIETSEEEVTNE